MRTTARKHNFRQQHASCRRLMRSIERLEQRHLLAVTLGTDTAAISEQDGVATIAATLSAAVTQDVTVELGFGGDAQQGVDYTASASAIVIPAGSTSGSVTVTAIQDEIDEPDEMVTVEIDAVTGDTEDGDQQVAVSILDDDVNIARSVVPAPIAPDGTVAGAKTDLVINLDRSFAPDIAGRTLLKGKTIRVTLPEEFINTGSVPFADIFGSATCTPGNVQCSTAILVEGWPQNPVLPFFPPRPEGQGTQQYSVELDGTHTIVYTALTDLVPGTPGFGPGIKSLHLLLNGFTNPAAPGLYEITVEAETGPGGVLEMGTAQVDILAETQPMISVTSVFNPGNPNTIYQTGRVGQPLPLPYDFLLWDSDGEPLTGVTIEMVDDTRALLRQDDATIGEVQIDGPGDATGNLLSSRGPSVEINAPVSSIPTARLTVDFQVGSALGEYVLTFELTDGNSQQMFVTATPGPVSVDFTKTRASADSNVWTGDGDINGDGNDDELNLVATLTAAEQDGNIIRITAFEYAFDHPAGGTVVSSLTGQVNLATGQVNLSGVVVSDDTPLIPKGYRAILDAQVSPIGLDPLGQVDGTIQFDTPDPRLCASQGDPVADAPFNMVDAFCIAPPSVGIPGGPADISETGGIVAANASGRVDAIVVFAPDQIALFGDDTVTYTATADWTTEAPDAVVRDWMVNFTFDPPAAQPLTNTGAEPPLVPTELSQTPTSATISMREIAAVDLGNLPAPRVERYHMRITGLAPHEEVTFSFTASGGQVETVSSNIASSVIPAPIAPDGNVAGAITDLVINLDRSLAPDIAGRTLLKGNTIRVTLPEEFINTGSVPFADIFGSTTCTPGNVQCSTAILVEGWPQNPVLPFFPPRPEGQGTQQYSVELDGTHTIVYTALTDLVPGTPGFGPGIKALHLLLNGFTNPAAPGLYEITVEAETGPGGALETGTVEVEILAETQPMISVTSVFNAGNPNTIYQSGPAGGPLPLPYDFLLWDGDGEPLTGVTIEMVDDTRALLRRSDVTIGEVQIDGPEGATGNLLSSRGPSAEINAPVSSIPTARLTVDFEIGSALGDYVLTFSLNDGNSQQMFVRAVNVPPVISDPGRQTLVATQETHDIEVMATDANSVDTLTYSATPRTAEYYLDQTIGLNFTGDLFEDFSGLGEKWLLSDAGVWHYITPDGNFYEWLGGSVFNRTWLAQLATATFDDPSLLYDAQADATAPATASVTGSTVTLDPADGFRGTFAVELSVSDGTNSDSVLFPVDVIDNVAPQLTNPGDQSLPTTQDQLEVELAATDLPGDSIAFTATVETAEYYFDQTLDLQVFQDELFLNWSGSVNEVWLLGGNTWYFLTPEGGFYRWLGGGRNILANSELVATFSPATYETPALLHDAQPGGSVPATASIDDSTLTIDPNPGFVGVFGVLITATDSGGLSDSQLIRVDVTAGAAIAATKPVVWIGKFEMLASPSQPNTSSEISELGFDTDLERGRLAADESTVSSVRERAIDLVYSDLDQDGLDELQVDGDLLSGD